MSSIPPAGLEVPGRRGISQGDGMSTDELRELADRLENDARAAVGVDKEELAAACFQAAASYRIVAELKEIDRSLGTLS